MGIHGATLRTYWIRLLTASNKESSFLMKIPQEPIQAITEEHIADFGLQLVHDKTKALTELIDDLKYALENAFPAELSEINETNTDEVISVKSKKSKQEPKAIVSSHPSSLFQITKAENQTQPEKQDIESKPSASVFK